MMAHVLTVGTIRVMGDDDNAELCTMQHTATTTCTYICSGTKGGDARMQFVWVIQHQVVACVNVILTGVVSEAACVTGMRGTDAVMVDECVSEPQ